MTKEDAESVKLLPRLTKDEIDVLKRLDTEPTSETAQSLKAPFRLEIHLGARRSISSMDGILMAFQSGRRLSGDGDDMMFWCGHPDCRQPIKGDFLQAASVDCPFCNGSSFRSKEHKSAVIAHKGLTAGQRQDLAKMPVLVPSWQFTKTHPRKVAQLIVREWIRFARQADIAVIFSPHDIRTTGVSALILPDHLGKARRARDARNVVYPLSRIFKDLSVPGVTLENRVFSLLQG